MIYRLWCTKGFYHHRGKDIFVYDTTTGETHWKFYVNRGETWEHVYNAPLILEIDLT